MRDDLIFVAMLKKNGIEYHNMVVSDSKTNSQMLYVTIMDGDYGTTFRFDADGTLNSVLVGV